MQPGNRFASRRLATLLLLGSLLAGRPVTGAVQAAPAGLIVYFYREGQAVAVARPGAPVGDAQTDAAALMRALLAGTTTQERAEGLTSALPTGSDLAALTVQGEQVTVDLHLPSDFLAHQLDPYLSDMLVDQVVKTLHPLGLLHVEVRAARPDGRFQPVSIFLPRPRLPVPAVPANDDPLPDQPAVSPDHTGQPPGYGQGQPVGALTGKTVWLSAGHGWYWSDTLHRWNTQRPNTYGIVEDFADAEAVNYYLARYLWNAGAQVWLVREHDGNENQVIVDNDGGAPGYGETGAWTTSGTPGYADGTYRYANTAAEPTATATWTPSLPDAGWYSVWAWYRHGTNRPTDAHYEIHHGGGVTDVRLSQEVHGQTWRWLGDYYFPAGTTGHVTLVNDSGDPAQAVIADAARFGGGLGSIAAPGGTSGEPRWEEAAQYWAQYQGAPAEVYGNDVTARPLYAEWETAKGYPGEADNAVFVSWHTNAGGGTGSESYTHSYEPTPGSAALQDWIHPELIADLRAAWNPAWRDRGQKTADFGELRELSTMPGVLLEVAFHDTEDPGDADDLREPVFRQVAARAVAQGIVKYFAARDGLPLQLAPEPPTRLVARNSGAGRVTLSWTAPPCCDGLVGDAATGYKVYRSADGGGFDDGLPVTSAGATVDGLAPGTVVFFRVTALNDGGESFPSPVVAVRVPIGGRAPEFLVVDGFDRLDQAALIWQYESPVLGTAGRMFLERMNSYDYAAAHGQALTGAGLAFDGATDEAVTAGGVALGGYPAVDWFTGEDSVADVSLDAQARVQIAAYLANGGSLLLSGSEIGYDLVELGRDPAFFSNVLRATYAGDDADTYQWAGTAGGLFGGLSGRFDDSTSGAYDVGYPDRLAPAGGSAVALAYVGGSGGGAGLVYAGDYRLVYLGFPLEAVTDAGRRQGIVSAAAGFLLQGWEPPPTWDVYVPLVVRQDRP